MPYILISTQIRMENGPTVVGDVHSDPSLMALIGAKLVQHLGNNFAEYNVQEPPRLVVTFLGFPMYLLHLLTLIKRC